MDVEYFRDGIGGLMAQAASSSKLFTQCLSKTHKVRGNCFPVKSGELGTLKRFLRCGVQVK